MQEIDNTAAVAGDIGVPEATLVQWRYLGKGPSYIKVGRHVRYRRTDVDAWLAEHTVATDAA